uniref:tRNA synthetases class I catalytic domain-containing protein n=1 Tax=Sphenodon punctatus TaxID=8508 RepID=A0A8D0L8F1_SPHPU
MLSVGLWGGRAAASQCLCASSWGSPSLSAAERGLRPGKFFQARCLSGCGPGKGKRWIKPAGRDTGIQIYNSLSRSKEPFILGNADVVTWYSCGPTVYDHAHLGHACSYVRFDIIRRIMTKIFGCEVVMVMGITDVDDKIIKRASEVNVY